LTQLQGHYDEIREWMLDLMGNDQEFSNAIELKTSGREQSDKTPLRMSLRAASHEVLNQTFESIAFCSH
jgi:hypothetical protein